MGERSETGGSRAYPRWTPSAMADLRRRYPGLDDPTLALLDYASIDKLRSEHTSQDAQDYFGPLEHTAYARGATLEGLPIWGELGIPGPVWGAVQAIGSPIRDALKARGILGGRSQPSAESARAGLLGWIQGLEDYAGSKTKTRVHTPTGLLDD